MREMKEIAKEILEKKFSGDPQKMANELGLGLMYVRRAVGKAAQEGGNVQKTFEFTVKILPLCKELGIDPARELKAPTDQEVFNEIQSTGKATRGNAKRRKKGHEAAPVGPISTRRIAGDQGRKS